jgi:hypothetical protein
MQSAELRVTEEICAHTLIHQGPWREFAGPVFTRGVTPENRAAQGASSRMECCIGCGAERAVNFNLDAVEYSAWGQSAKVRKALLERIELECAKRASRIIMDKEIEVIRVVLLPHHSSFFTDVANKHLVVGRDWRAHVVVHGFEQHAGRKAWTLAAHNPENEPPVRALWKRMVDCIEAASHEADSLHDKLPR